MKVISLEIDPKRANEAILAANRHLRMVRKEITDGNLPKFFEAPQGGALLLPPESSKKQPALVDIGLIPILLEESRL